MPFAEFTSATNIRPSKVVAAILFPAALSRTRTRLALNSPVATGICAVCASCSESADATEKTEIVPFALSPTYRNLPSVLNVKSCGSGPALTEAPATNCPFCTVNNFIRASVESLTAITPCEETSAPCAFATDVVAVLSVNFPFAPMLANCKLAAPKGDPDMPTTRFAFAENANSGKVIRAADPLSAVSFPDTSVNPATSPEILHQKQVASHGWR